MFGRCRRRLRRRVWCTRPHTRVYLPIKRASRRALETIQASAIKIRAHTWRTQIYWNCYARTSMQTCTHTNSRTHARTSWCAAPEQAQHTCTGGEWWGNKLGRRPQVTTANGTAVNDLSLGNAVGKMCDNRQQQQWQNTVHLQQQRQQKVFKKKIYQLF